MIKFLSLEEYGVLPEKCICPICGAEVTVEKMAYEGTSPHLYKAPGRVGYSNGSSPTKGKLSCGHEFDYNDIDHTILQELHDQYGYVYKIREFAEQGRYFLSDEEIKVINKVRGDIEKIFSLTSQRTYYMIKYNDKEAYEKLYNHFGDVKFDFEELKFFYGLKRRNPLDNPSFTIEEFETLCDEDKEDSRYIMYLEQVISNNWGELDEEGFMVPPIDFWEIPEEKKKEVYEFTINLYKNKEVKK